MFGCQAKRRKELHLPAFPSPPPSVLRGCQGTPGPLFAFLNAWDALAKAKVIYRGEEEDAEPHGLSVTDSSPRGELHKYPEPPKPLTKRSCSLLHTEGSWKTSEGSLSLHCCALLPSQSPGCKRCCYHMALKAESPLSSPDLLQTSHSAFPPLPTNTLQPGLSIVLTIPSTRQHTAVKGSLCQALVLRAYGLR